MPPALSIVLVAHEMQRELPRTLRSLDLPYQRAIERDAYEVIVVDNGSAHPPDERTLAHFSGRLRATHVEAAPQSPAMAANRGLEMAQGEIVGLLIDGARIASPGLLSGALMGSRVAETPVVATLGWHLGPDTHMDAARSGYDRQAEDRMLTEAGWEEDGYRLFALSSLSGSSRRGWFGPLGESNALFMHRRMWEQLGGLDTRFSLPGGGLVNHDLYSRACALPGAQLVVVLGEGPFHQIHDGASTSRRVSRETAFADYEAHRGHPYSPPRNPAIYVGGVPATALEDLDYSVRWALRAGSSEAEPAMRGTSRRTRSSDHGT